MLELARVSDLFRRGKDGGGKHRLVLNKKRGYDSRHGPRTAKKLNLNLSLPSHGCHQQETEGVGILRSTNLMFTSASKSLAPRFEGKVKGEVDIAPFTADEG